MFSFRKRTPEDEEVPPEPVEGETTDPTVVHVDDGVSRMRRPLLFAAIGVVLIGGVYLANSLFFSAPPPPPTPTRPITPVPVSPAPAAPAPTKETAKTLAPPQAPQGQPETKAPTPTTPSKGPEPAKPGTPAKVAPEVSIPAKPVPQTKPTPEQATPKPSVAQSNIPPPAANKSEASGPTKAAVPPTKGFSVQLGAMAQQANAENLKRKLDGMGYQATIRKGSGFVNNHVVTVGDPTGKREADEMARRLNVDGFPSQVVAMEGKYVPQIGSFVNLDEAIDVARELQKKNYRPKITSKPTATMVLFQVRHGQFDTRAAAMKRGEELKTKGFNAWVVPN